MDTVGTEAHVTSAAERAALHSLASPLLLGDLGLFSCWASLMAGDLSRAKKAARTTEKAFALELTGTPLWAKLGVRLATHSGRATREAERDFAELKASIGTRTVHSIEKFSLVALLLHSKQRGDHAAVSSFVRSQFPRIEATSGQVWPFVLEHLA
jgi:hypothetical protein